VSHLVEASDSGIVNVPGTVSATCHFTFEFSGVKKADFYKLSIGRVPGPTYSYQDLVNANWQMTVR
jgi:hypothetical protein